METALQERQHEKSYTEYLVKKNMKLREQLFVATWRLKKIKSALTSSLQSAAIINQCLKSIPDHAQKDHNISQHRQRQLLLEAG